MACPLDLINPMRLVLRPMALMAITIRNLDSCLSGAKKLLGTPKALISVVRRDARIKYRIKRGKTFLSLKAMLIVFLSTLPVGEEESNRG